MILQYENLTEDEKKCAYHYLVRKFDPKVCFRCQSEVVLHLVWNGRNEKEACTMLSNTSGASISDLPSLSLNRFAFQFQSIALLIKTIEKLKSHFMYEILL